MKEIEMSLNPVHFGVVLKLFPALQRKEAKAREDFWELVNPVKENLFNFIYKALNFSEDANDVFQDTLFRAFKYIQSYNKKNPFKNWLFAIAHNEIKKYFKKTGNLSNPIQLDVQHWLSQDKGHEAMVQAIYEMAQDLRPKHRKIFFLFYDQGFSIKEISDISGLKEGNIKVILNMSRKKIKEKLGVDHEK
jgi:RNA polymerase sigma-70 factor (ECF subfamily)